MEQAAAETELSRYQLKQLLDVGIIKSLQKADSNNRDWLICKKSWQRMINNFKKTSLQDHSSQGLSLSGIQKQGFMITDIFRMLTKSQLSCVFEESPRKPFSFKQLINFNLNKFQHRQVKKY